MSMRAKVIKRTKEKSTNINDDIEDEDYTQEQFIEDN